MSACKVPAHPYHSPVNHLNIRWRRHPTWGENEWFWSASGSKQMKLYLNEWDDAESKAETKESAKRGEKLNRSHSNASLKLWTGSIFNILSVQDLFWNHHSRNKSLLHLKAHLWQSPGQRICWGWPNLLPRHCRWPLHSYPQNKLSSYQRLWFRVDMNIDGLPLAGV